MRAASASLLRLSSRRVVAPSASSLSPSSLINLNNNLTAFRLLSSSSSPPPPPPPASSSAPPSAPSLDDIVVTKTAPSPSDETDAKVADILELQASLKDALLSSASYEDCLEISETIILKTSVLFPPEEKPHPALARAHNDHGYLHKSHGQHHLAIESYHRAIQLYLTATGPASSGYANALANVAVCYREYAASIPSTAEDAEKTKSGLLARAREAGESASAAAETRLEKMEEKIKEAFDDPDEDMAVYRYTDRHLHAARRESVQHLQLLGSIYTAQGSELLSAGAGKKKASRVAKSILDKAEEILRKCTAASLEMDKTPSADLFLLETSISPLLSNSLNALGILLKLKGQATKGLGRGEAWKEAELCYRKALAGRCKVLKCEHEDVIKVSAPFVCSSVRSFARVYYLSLPKSRSTGSSGSGPRAGSFPLPRLSNFAPLRNYPSFIPCPASQLVLAPAAPSSLACLRIAAPPWHPLGFLPFQLSLASFRCPRSVFKICF